MTREDLYSLAFRYRKTKLWLRLFDTQVFAVRTEKGETIFICIMGRMGEHISVAVYPENEFYSYYHFLDADPIFDDMMIPDVFENYISSSCIQCSFENKDMMHPSDLEEVREYARSQGIRIAGKNAFPLFTRYTPCMYPWVVNSEHDLELLAAGLEAAIALSDELDHNASLREQLRRIDGKSVHEVPLFVHTPEGYRHSGMAALPPRRDASYPSGNYSNEEILRKIRSKRRKGIIDCRVTWLNNPVQEHPDDVPYYPAILIAVEESDGKVMSMSLTRDYESGYNQLLSEFMATLSARKMRPQKIFVQNARTFALLAETMEKASIDIAQDTDLPDLDVALFDLYDHMLATDACAVEPGPAEPADFSQIEKGLTMMLTEIEAMGDELLRYLPEEVTESLSELSVTPGIPSALKERIDSLLRRLDGLGQDSRGSGNNKRGKGTSRNEKAGKSKKTGKGLARAEEPLSYVISVSPYTGCYRHIRVCADITLEELHNIIQDVFLFDNDHLYAFFMDDKAWSSRDAYFSPDNREGRSAANYRLRDIALFKGKKFLYLFDFGDEWCFECRILRAITENTTGYQILRSKGAAPEQYPDYFFDDEDDYEDDEDDDPFE